MTCRLFLSMATAGEVLVMLSKGVSYPEIARLLQLQLGTVQSHIKSIYRKLDISSKAEAAAIAAKLGLIYS